MYYKIGKGFNKKGKIMANNNKKITRLKDLEQIDGRDSENETVPTTLDSLFGGAGLGKYRTSNRESYAHELDDYNTAELRNHAINIGLIPIANINRLKKQLLIEFDKFNLVAKNNTKPRPRVISESNKEIALKILSAVK